MKQNFTVRQGDLDDVEAFLSVAQHRSFRRPVAELGVARRRSARPCARSRRALARRCSYARRAGLTEAGKRFSARAKLAFEELVAARETREVEQMAGIMW